MAIVANTYTSFAAKGIREDLSEVISNIAPTEVPLISNAGKESVKNTFFEWQVDSLNAVDLANSAVEGDDIGSFDAVQPTTRLGAYTQIFRKTIISADTLEAVDKAGRKSELAYGIAKKAKELRRDMEAIYCSNQGAAAGSTTVSRKTPSLLAYINVNTNMGAGGANPTYTNIPTGTRTDGTQRAFSEAILKDVVQQMWKNGAECDMLMVGPVNKQRVSTFTGISQQRTETGNKAATIIGAADVYLSDFGKLSIVPSRFMRERDALFIDTNFVSLATLRPYAVKELAKTGDAEKRMLICEQGLKVLNPAALGIAADLTTT